MMDTIGKEFGNLNVLSDKFKNDLLASSVEATKLGGGIQEASSITKALSSEFGIASEDAAKLSGKVFDTSIAIGLSADEGAKLFGTLMQTANMSKEQAEQLAEGTFQLAEMNDVAPSVVMKDIAASSETIANFTEKGGKNIGEAAVQARKLGITLDTSAKIAEGLLDFESSITKEVEASVLIGKQLNFQKAREAALNNDIAGATREVVKQLGSEQDFLNLNIIQRKALADSIGVSVSEMSKLVGETDKLTLKGALASGSFGDLFGKDSLTTLSQLTSEIKSIAAALMIELGPSLLTIVGAFSFLASGISAVISGLNEIGVLLPLIVTGLTFFAAKSIAAASASIMKAYAEVGAKGALLPPPLNIAAWVAGTAGLATLMLAGKTASKMNDGVVGRGGITTMMGPAGIFNLNPMDSVLATTNPIPVNDVTAFGAGKAPNKQGIYINLDQRRTGRNIDWFVKNGTEYQGEPGDYESLGAA
jgi:hypothetical protein